MAITPMVAPTGTADAGADDPFRYGWRHALRNQTDGTSVVDQVPLTLEDVLHPEEGDFVVQSDLHQRICTYLCDVLRAQLGSVPGATVLGDVRIAWDVPELRPHGPDVAVIFGVREQQNWSTFDVSQEGVRPTLFIEVTSPHTRQLDLYHKLDEYDLAGVPLYIIVDIVQRRQQTFLRVLGYQQTEIAYMPLAANARGWLWLEPIGLWIGVREQAVVLFDQAGTPIGDYAAVAEALATAEARVRLLEAELKRLRGEE